MYCIYTDKDVSDEEGNLDHIIPLSLGGLDGFWVWADKKYNSEIGQKVDGPIANDPIIMFARREADARGHSGAEPTPIWRKSEFEGRPVQVQFGKDGLRIWDAKTRTYLDEEYTKGKLIQSAHCIDRYAPIRFLAKAALGGAYFVYEDEFRKSVDCDELRRLITLDVESARNDPAFKNSEVVICDRFHPDAQHNPNGVMYKALCEFTQRSTLILEPHHEAISIHVGVVGVYIGSVILPAKTESLPIDDDKFDVGHVVLLSPGSIERISLRQLAGRWYTLNTDEHPPPPPERDPIVEP